MPKIIHVAIYTIFILCYNKLRRSNEVTQNWKIERMEVYNEETTEKSG